MQVAPHIEAQAPIEATCCHKSRTLTHTHIDTHFAASFAGDRLPRAQSCSRHNLQRRWRLKAGSVVIAEPAVLLTNFRPELERHIGLCRRAARLESLLRAVEAGALLVARAAGAKPTAEQFWMRCDWQITLCACLSDQSRGRQLVSFAKRTLDLFAAGRFTAWACRSRTLLQSQEQLSARLPIWDRRYNAGSRPAAEGGGGGGGIGSDVFARTLAAIPQEFHCAICLEVYERPTELEDCGHTFCAPCGEPVSPPAC